METPMWKSSFPVLPEMLSGRNGCRDRSRCPCPGACPLPQRHPHRRGCDGRPAGGAGEHRLSGLAYDVRRGSRRSEEHTSELQSLMRISYAVFCLKKKNKHRTLAARYSGKITTNNISST